MFIAKRLSRRNDPRRPRPADLRFRPHLWALEDRSLPSTTWGDQPVSVSVTPNDPGYGNLYGMKKISAPAAWDTTTGSTSVVVANIDTGIDYTHEDLYLNIWINQREIPASRLQNLTDVDGDGLFTFRDLNNSVNQGEGKANDVDGNGRIDARDILAPMERLVLVDTGRGGWADSLDTDANTYRDDLVGWNFVNNSNNPFDQHSHGTHTAGTLGAMGNNAIGVVGVNWTVQIMALQIMGASGTGSVSWAVNAVRYAADMGARVSNNSWGFYGGATGDALYQAIQYAGAHGHLFVAAAGNDGLNNDTSAYRLFPASYDLDNIVSVAATDRRDRMPWWSNYGPTSVDLGAPGVSVMSTVPGGYASYSGTSMATPHVAGAAALLLANDPTLTAAQLKDRILRSVDPVRSLRDKVLTGGRLNVARAMTASGSVGGMGAGDDLPGEGTLSFPALPGGGLIGILTGAAAPSETEEESPPAPSHGTWVEGGPTAEAMVIIDLTPLVQNATKRSAADEVFVADAPVVQLAQDPEVFAAFLRGGLGI